MSLSEIQTRIDAALHDAARPSGAARLIAVSKKQPEPRIEAVLHQGHRLFGENRVQEAAGRWPGYRERFSGIELHLIGPLQTNKVGQAMDLFDVIQSVYRPKLAKKIADLAHEKGACPRLLVQVNTGEEEQKAGVLPADTEALVALVRAEGLPLQGLMCIPPVEDAPSGHFAFLKRMSDDLGLPWVSMGMSGDYPAAVELGATHIRVGSAIFGKRAPLNP